MIIVYSVICYNPSTGHELSIAGWSANKSEARELESQLNDLAKHVEYQTAAIWLYGATTEYQTYGDFDALIRDGFFCAIAPAGQGEHYRYSHEGVADVVHSTNLLR